MKAGKSVLVIGSSQFSSILFTTIPDLGRSQSNGWTQSRRNSFTEPGLPGGAVLA